MDPLPVRRVDGHRLHGIVEHLGQATSRHSRNVLRHGGPPRILLSVMPPDAVLHWGQARDGYGGGQWR